MKNNVNALITKNIHHENQGSCSKAKIILKNVKLITNVNQLFLNL